LPRILVLRVVEWNFWVGLGNGGELTIAKWSKPRGAAEAKAIRGIQRTKGKREYIVRGEV
jgi:hypothetical protein